ncbi:MAG: DUF1858 domain-containing protein [Lachnospiraceae bacterium]|nr:DUF1858 domain-containing protein [Lachnospiraceae bacterium]
MKITPDMLIGEIIAVDTGLIPVLMASGMHCVGCPSSQMESLAEAAMVHGIPVDYLVDNLNEYLEAKGE